MLVSVSELKRPKTTPDRRPIIAYAHLLSDVLIDTKVPSARSLRVLNLGCGKSNETAAILCATKFGLNIPQVSVLGVDKDPQSIAVAQESDFHICGFQSRSVVGDVRNLGQTIYGSYGLCTIRHPNMRANADAWDEALASLPSFLSRDAVVVVTTYATSEADVFRGLLQKHFYQVEQDYPNKYSIAFSDMPGCSTCRYDNHLIVASIKLS